MGRAQSPLLAYAKIITDFMVIYRGATKYVLHCNKADRKGIKKTADEIRVVLFNVSTEDFHV